MTFLFEGDEWLAGTVRRAATLRGVELDKAVDASRRGLATREQRILTCAATAVDKTTREECALWLIEHEPGLDFGNLLEAVGFWDTVGMSCQAMRAAWEKRIAFDNNVVVPSVVRNATASSVREDPSFGESLYLRAMIIDPLNPSWHVGLGEVYEMWADLRSVDGDLESLTPPHFADRVALARLALSHFTSAFFFLARDARRKDLLWRMRQCAAVAGEGWLREGIKSTDE